MVLAFGALSGPPPSSETVAKVSGIIAQCPLLRRTYHSKVTTVAVNALSKISPYLQVPATIPINVGSSVRPPLAPEESFLTLRKTRGSRMILRSKRRCSTTPFAWGKVLCAASTIFFRRFVGEPGQQVLCLRYFGFYL